MDKHSHFCLFLTAVRLIPDSVFYLPEVVHLGLVMFSWL
jgi:hypothetical protein